jgi:protein SCO1
VSADPLAREPSLAGTDRQSRRHIVAVWTLLAATAAWTTACAPPATQSSGPPTNPAGVAVSTLADDTTYHGAELHPPYPMPDISLTATDGKPYNLRSESASSPVTIVFFGYTACPDVCPLVMSDLTAALLQSSAQVRRSTRLLFITTDPARDSPAVLRGYLDHYNHGFVGLTGRLRDIRAAGAALGVLVGGRHRSPGGGYEVLHGTQVIGVRGSEARVVWTQGTPVADLVADLGRLAEDHPTG